MLRVMEMLRLEFYIPRGLRDTDSVKKVEELLEKVRSSLNLDVKEFIIDEDGERELKSKILWGLSVAKRIKIEQTRKTKSLYPHLVVLIDGRPVTFYPQKRPDRKITIEEFLEGLLRGEVRCLHEKFEIEDELLKGEKGG